MNSRKWIIGCAAAAAVVIAVLLLIGGKSKTEVYNSADELRGKTIAAISGAATGGMVERYFEGDVTLAYYNTNSDMAAALKAGKVDAYVADVFAERYLCEEYTGQKVLEETPIQVNSVGFFFSRDSEKAAGLCADMNAMLKELSETGKLKELEQKWSGNEKAEINISLSEDAEVLKFTCCSSIGRPFCYVQDNQIVGYEIELLYLFCERYHFRPEIIDSDYGGMLPSVATGKADFGGTCTSITEERQKQCLFSDPSISIAFDLVVNKEGVSDEEQSFLKKISEDFYGNFIEESRWKLYVSGIGKTILITLMAVIFGTVFGQGLFYLSYDGRKAVNKIIDFCMWLVHGMPVVVFLMILYYIVFGRTSWSGTLISIIAFTVIFASTYVGMLRNSYRAIGQGQIEAAIALGYSPFMALRKRIFPQMVGYFRPEYEEAVVSLLKSTAVVGYIAVQDVTKVSDIIRGRTFKAFFPLIVTTVLYFCIAALIKLALEALFKRFDNRSRTDSQILEWGGDR